MKGTHRCTGGGRSSGILSMLAVAALTLPVAILEAEPTTGDFEIDWWTVDAGGMMSSTGVDFELSGTIGQPDANTVVLSGGDFELTGGFWFGFAPGDWHHNWRPSTRLPRPNRWMNRPTWAVARSLRSRCPPFASRSSPLLGPSIGWPRPCAPERLRWSDGCRAGGCCWIYAR